MANSISENISPILEFILEERERMTEWEKNKDRSEKSLRQANASLDEISLLVKNTFVELFSRSRLSLFAVLLLVRWVLWWGLFVFDVVWFYSPQFDISFLLGSVRYATYNNSWMREMKRISVRERKMIIGKCENFVAFSLRFRIEVGKKHIFSIIALGPTKTKM